MRKGVSRDTDRKKKVIQQGHIISNLHEKHKHDIEDMIKMAEKAETTIALNGGRMGRSDKVSLWCVALLINTRFRFFFILEWAIIVKRINVTLRQRASKWLGEVIKL